MLLSEALLAREMPSPWLSSTQRWNEPGKAELVGCALVGGRVEAIKLFALDMTGAVLSLSRQRAGVVLQAFFVGNVLWKSAVAGPLYQDAAVRVCNAYRLDDQPDLGLARVLIAAGARVVWSVRAVARAGPTDRCPCRNATPGSGPARRTPCRRPRTVRCACRRRSGPRPLRRARHAHAGRHHRHDCPEVIARAGIDERVKALGRLHADAPGFSGGPFVGPPHMTVPDRRSSAATH